MRHLPFAVSLALATLLLTPAAVFAGTFPDVEDTHPHATAITALQSSGIITGYGDGTFRPDQPVTRAEAVAIIMRAAGISGSSSTSPLTFTDVPDSAWFFGLVKRAVELQKVEGYEDKTFRPDNPVILPEALKLTLGFYNINVKNIDVDLVIYDGLKRSEWYSPYAQYAKNKNLIEPGVDGKIDPTVGLNRAQVAEIIYRMRLAQQTGKAFDLTTNWVSDEHPENFWRMKRPADWKVFKGIKNSVIWSADTGRVFFTRVAPKSAQLSISVVENTAGQSASAYFEETKALYRTEYDKHDPVFLSTTLGGRSALKIIIKSNDTIDAVVSLPNGDFLVMYGESGEGKIGEFLQKQLSAMIDSYEFVEKPLTPPPPAVPLEDRLETLREQVLIANGWQVASPLFPYKKLIETDAIGIGTGPVDYYYSKEANHTIKLERGTQTILNIREGETTGF